MLRVIKRHVPLPVKKAIRRSLSLLRTELPYLEFHLTDHCNLNCKGCAHYSPMASDHYADLHQLEKDLQRLAQLFRNIRLIRLMGGEPLLHPDVDRFIRTTRSAFPKSRIRIVTNGILLPQASQAFWDACRETNTSIDLTVYPPAQEHVDDYRALCEREGVFISTRDVESFVAHFNSKGDSQVDKAFRLCPIEYYCRFLQDGHLYPCAKPALVHYFNESFDLKVTADEGIDIYSPSLSGREVLMRLNKPIDTCRWCSYDLVPFAWETSNRVVEDWDAEAHREKVGSSV